MSKSVENKIECPFYIEETQNYILCEGIIANTTQKNIFSSNEEKLEYELNVCSINGGRKCLHYRNLHKQYDIGER